MEGFNTLFILDRNKYEEDVLLYACNNINNINNSCVPSSLQMK